MYIKMPKGARGGSEGWEEGREGWEGWEGGVEMWDVGQYL